MTVQICKICGGPIRSDNKLGICARNEDCNRARRNERSRKNREDPDFTAKENARRKVRRARQKREDPEYRVKENARDRVRYQRNIEEDPEYRMKRISESVLDGIVFQ